MLGPAGAAEDAVGVTTGAVVGGETGGAGAVVTGTGGGVAAVRTVPDFDEGGTSLDCCVDALADEVEGAGCLRNVAIVELAAIFDECDVGV